MAWLSSYRETAKDFQAAAEAAGERQFHANHVCTDKCDPDAYCAIHGKPTENCDENCLEATHPELFASRTYKR